MEQFAEILKDLIVEKGLSLRKIAEESKVSAMQYSKYLRGTTPKIMVAVRIAEYFDCSVDYLFGLTENKGNLNYLPVDMTKFVDRYLKILDESKITHWKFAKKVNLSESSLRHWKYGDIPKIETLLIIAKELNSSIDYLIGRKDIE